MKHFNFWIATKIKVDTTIPVLKLHWKACKQQNRSFFVRFFVLYKFFFLISIFSNFIVFVTKLFLHQYIILILLMLMWLRTSSEDIFSRFWKKKSFLIIKFLLTYSSLVQNTYRRYRFWTRRFKCIFWTTWSGWRNRRTFANWKRVYISCNCFTSNWDFSGICRYFLSIQVRIFFVKVINEKLRFCSWNAIVWVLQIWIYRVRATNRVQNSSFEFFLGKWERIRIFLLFGLINLKTIVVYIIT